MADDPKTQKAMSNDAVWELIPWYVNGSLSQAETAEVEAYSADCEDFALEIERQRELAKNVAALDPPDYSASRSWEILSAQIAAEERSKHPKRSIWGFLPEIPRGLAVGGALAAVLLVAVIAQDPDGGGFQTLTNQEQTDPLAIKFQTVSELDPVKLQEILADRDLILVEGPSETGIYRAVAAAGTDVDAMANALTALPEIAFAAAEALP